MESNSNDIKDLIIKIGELHKEMVSLKKDLENIRVKESEINLGTNIAISNSKLKPNDIKFTIKNI